MQNTTRSLFLFKPAGIRNNWKKAIEKWYNIPTRGLEKRNRKHTFTKTHAFADACWGVCKLWWDPRQRLTLGQLGVSEKNTQSRMTALRDSTLQGSCDLDLIESISKWLEKSEDGTHCNAFRDISIAGLRTRHQRIQCIINCKHEIQQGSCCLKTQNNPPLEYSVALSNPQKINLLFSHGLQIQGESRERAPGLFSASSVEVG